MSRNEEFEVLGEVRVVQKKSGNLKLKISNDLIEDEAMHITFLAIQIEEIAHRLNMPIEKVWEFIEDNIKVEPMEFD